MIDTPAHYFTKAAAVLLAAQNTADDGEWTYKAEPVQGNAANLYTVTIYGQDGQKIGSL
jgi:hypothetical protein